MATNAVAFNGSSQYGKISNISAFDALTNFTVECWVKNTSSSPAYAPYMTLGANGSGEFFYLSTENGTGHEGFNFSTDYATTNADGYESSARFLQNTWKHAALVHNATLKKSFVLIDGVENHAYDLQQTGVGALGDPSGFDLFIATWPPIDVLFDGAIGGFLRLWNRALSASEIYYNRNLILTPANESGLVVNCNFAEGSGSTIDNDATAGADIALVGSPSWTTGPTTSNKSYTNTYHFNQVRQSADDAEEPNSGGTTDIASSDYEIIKDGSTVQQVGLRFQSVVVPNGATIAAAYLRFVGKDTASSGTENADIYGEDVDNSSVFAASTNNLTGRTKTTAKVDWDGVAGTSGGVLQSTPDIKTIVQEIVDRGSWASGNAMTFIIAPGGSDATRNFHSYDNQPYSSAMLHIEYTAGTTHTKNLTEVIVLVDSVYRSPARRLSETVTLVDSIHRSAARVFSEVVVLADSVVRSISRSLSEIVVLVDAFAGARALLRTYTETITLVDSIAKAPTKLLSEVVVLVDSISTSRIFARTYTEAVVLVDTLSRSVSRTFSEAVALVDTVSRSVSRSFSETITLVDSVYRSVLRYVSEVVVLNDAVSAVKITLKNLSETIVLVDSLSRSVSRTLSDAITLVDTKLTSFSRTLADTVVLVDSFASSITYTRVFTEIVILGDSVSRAVQRTLSEAVTLVDSMARSIGRGLTESIVVKDERENLCSNPSFETTASGFWSGSATRSADYSHLGTYSAKTTCGFTSGAITSGHNYLNSNAGIQPTPGKKYTFKVRVYVPVGSPITRLYMGIRNNGNWAYLSPRVDVYTTPGEWVEGIAEYTANESSPWMRFTVADPYAPGFTGSASYYCDSILIEEVDTAGEYFDGNFARSRWLGTAETSISRVSNMAVSLVRGLTESVTLVDGISKAVELVFAEVFTITDSIVRSIERNFTESIPLEAFLSKSTLRGFAELVTISDQLIRSISRPFTEVVTLSDSIIRSVARTLSDAVVLVDVVSKSVSRGFSEAITLVDSFSHLLGRTLSEVITLTDSFGREISRSFSEVVTLVDTVAVDLVSRVTGVLTTLMVKGKHLAQRIRGHRTVLRNKDNRDILKNKTL